MNDDTTTKTRMEAVREDEARMTPLEVPTPPGRPSSRPKPPPRADEYKTRHMHDRRAAAYSRTALRSIGTLQDKNSWLMAPEWIAKQVGGDDVALGYSLLEAAQEAIVTAAAPHPDLDVATWLQSPEVQPAIRLAGEALAAFERAIARAAEHQQAAEASPVDDMLDVERQTLGCGVAVLDAAIEQVRGMMAAGTFDLKLNAHLAWVLKQRADVMAKLMQLDARKK